MATSGELRNACWVDPDFGFTSRRSPTTALRWFSNFIYLTTKFWKWAQSCSGWSAGSETKVWVHLGRVSKLARSCYLLHFDFHIFEYFHFICLARIGLSVSYEDVAWYMTYLMSLDTVSVHRLWILARYLQYSLQTSSKRMGPKS